MIAICIFLKTNKLLMCQFLVVLSCENNIQILFHPPITSKRKNTQLIKKKKTN